MRAGPSRRVGLTLVAVEAVALAAPMIGLNQLVQDDTVLIMDNVQVHALTRGWRVFAPPTGLIRGPLTPLLPRPRVSHLGAYADARREAEEARAQGLSPRTFGELRAGP